MDEQERRNKSKFKKEHDYTTSGIKITKDWAIFMNYERLKINFNPTPINMDEFYNAVNKTIEIIEDEGEAVEIGHVILIYIDNINNKPRFVSMGYDIAAEKEFFDDYIDKLQSEDISGSDKLGEDKYTLLYN